MYTAVDILFAQPVLWCANAMAGKQTLKPNFYAVVLNRTEWKVPKRYQKLTPIGSGAYGQVWLVSCDRKESFMLCYKYELVTRRTVVHDLSVLTSNDNANQ